MRGNFACRTEITICTKKQNRGPDGKTVWTAISCCMENQGELLNAGSAFASLANSATVMLCACASESEILPKL